MSRRTAGRSRLSAIKPTASAPMVSGRQQEPHPETAQLREHEREPRNGSHDDDAAQEPPLDPPLVATHQDPSPPRDTRASSWMKRSPVCPWAAGRPSAS